VEILSVNMESCNRDGICAAVCPSGLIIMDKDGYPGPVAEADEVCIRCGHCVAVCPTGSLSHMDVPVQQCASVQDELQLASEQCEHFLRKRRSIRNYKKKAVPKGDIERLIEIARFAPSGHNCQCTEWLVLGNQDELAKLSGIVAEWMRWMIANKPEFAASMHLSRTLGQWESGMDIILRNAPTVIVAHAEKENRMAPTTCTIALTYLELAATSMGLGCCWAGYFNAAATTFPPMLEALSLPNGHQSFGAMMMGYPRFNYHRLPLRRSPCITWRLSEPV
jgi:nitroreductase/NAD-dependent dihydropyrimidine dehydrogenase PreA subunit